MNFYINILSPDIPERYLNVFVLQKDLFLALSEDFGKGYEDNGGGDDSRGKVGNTFRKEHSFKADKPSEDKAQRYEYDYFSHDCEYKRGFGLPECNVHVLQGHLDKEHDRPHEEKRRVFYDDCPHVVARRKQYGINARESERHRPHQRRKNESNDSYVGYSFFESVGVSLAVVIAYERLQAVSESVEGQGDELKRAKHDGKSGGIVLVSARGKIEIDVKHYLYRALGNRHYKRGKAERDNCKNASCIRLHIFDPERENTFLREEEYYYPNKRYKLRNDSCKSRSVHAHSHCENKQRIERDVHYRAYENGKHGCERISLRRDKRIEPLRKQYEYGARRINFEVRRSKARGA